MGLCGTAVAGGWISGAPEELEGDDINDSFAAFEAQIACER
jgi:hypothetical protein